LTSLGSLARGLVLALVLMGLTHAVLASEDDISSLKACVSFFEDPAITVQDLAFYLVTHNYDAVPKDGYVELRLDGERYKLVPNGKAPNLCDISPMNSTDG